MRTPTTSTTTGLSEEGFVDIAGEIFYGIPDVDRLGPFLMSILSDTDQWMFVSSRGGLTAGRGDATSALFPYETDDRLHVAGGVTGPVTVIRRLDASKSSAWEPFRGTARSGVRRNLYKSVVGNQVVFEEVNRDLGLAFRYRWANSDRFGFVRTASLVNIGGEAASIELLDGLLNLLPSGLDPATYRTMSNLTNAYKRSEVVDAAARVAVYSLESRIVDRPEPGEVLTASVVWSRGLTEARISVDADHVESFRAGAGPTGGLLVTGRAGAYLVTSREEIEPGGAVEWAIVADVNQDQVQLVELRSFLRSAADPMAVLASARVQGTRSLVTMMASADALQRTGDQVATAHHFANVAFNAMRGGVFLSGINIQGGDFAAFVLSRNRPVALRHRSWLDALPDTVVRADLLDQVRELGDSQLTRLAREYLPLTFSRRHGDPSRPWNMFTIRVRDKEGLPIVHYEGNWRDIFQNWEALCMSFPAYLPSILALFLSSSTPDGFNPYRITRDGIDWEVPEPDNPWSNIGYWGDHQIVYLLRIVEMARRYLPGVVEAMLSDRAFSYADVPYRLVPFEQLVRDPRSSIEYDDAAADRIAANVAADGGDGRLLHDSDGEVYLANMVEKLLVSALSKLSNLVPGGGIWMNTQRPEWNDANNALVGNGLSMVTLYHLRRYLERVAALLDDSGLDRVEMSIEVADWLVATSAILEANAPQPDEGMSDQQRRATVDELGAAFSAYRARVYSAGFSGTRPLEISSVLALCDAAIVHLDDTIGRNRRADGLYHSYNLVHFASDGSAASIEHLPAMLEGQVAVLSSGLLDAEEKLAMLEALFASSMFRQDQRSFMLYPERTLPSFLDKNIIPPVDVAANSLLKSLIAAGDSSVVAVDGEGRYRFSAKFGNQSDLAAAIDRLARDERWRRLVTDNRDAVMATYETVFNHHAYTGRSGSMYAYEGIGSIYWHMVAKLLVAVQESILEAEGTKEPSNAGGRLIGFYWRIRSGLGFEKTAAEFGAFPTDPYSHTPKHAGAQQPGMTGQVKEEILTRSLELGLRVENGAIGFDPVLLRSAEFLASGGRWRVSVADGGERVLELQPYSFGFTVCQVPVIVSLTEGPPSIDVDHHDGSSRRFEGLVLDRPTSQSILTRRDEVAVVRVSLPRAAVVD